MNIQIKWMFPLLCFLFPLIYAKRSSRYAFPGSYCGGRTRELDGAILLSSRDRKYARSACVLKFVTDDDSIFNRERFMIIFHAFRITDCSVKLSIYYDRSSFGLPDAEFDCHTRQPPKVLYTPSKRLTLRLDKDTTEGYDFNIAITKFEEGSDYCSGFRCPNGSHCIDDDLRCDDVRNCLGGSDELGCRSHHHRSLIGAGLGSIMGISMSSLLCCVIASVLALLCCRKRRRSQQERAMMVTHTAKPIDVRAPPPPHYDGYQPAPPYAPGYPMQQGPPQGPPQNYAMTQFYPPPGQPQMPPPPAGGIYPPPPPGTYPLPPAGAAAIPQYV
ncbi:hypothetical protein CAPTEDRAFT_203245 [Capitella teleta]|uniref:CUB domain-containing protein n=1 Tax=Capitella teleta TaxID=283909 RepID=R7TSM1_CAPTE|nr:hypothetical protein CAPTEDRAFT_203245 [Capitella teleta]|eukprot:ELT96878.1 hypothetical protein CAPTEDRAFT_203245 [Capitella teleta]